MNFLLLFPLRMVLVAPLQHSCAQNTWLKTSDQKKFQELKRVQKWNSWSSFCRESLCTFNEDSNQCEPNLHRGGGGSGATNQSMNKKRWEFVMDSQEYDEAPVVSNVCHLYMPTFNCRHRVTQFNVYL